LKDRVLDLAKLALDKQVPDQLPPVVEPELVDVAEVQDADAAHQEPLDGAPAAPVAGQLVNNICDGSRCSVVDGVQLGDLGKCILEREPLSDGEPTEAIEYAVESNWSYDGSNRARRFVLYYFYAKCIFHISGRGNRIRLPACLVAEIRRRFPNPIGVPYVGYKLPTAANHQAFLTF
jgi:hypothetical protein